MPATNPLPKKLRIAAYDVDVIQWGLEEASLEHKHGEWSPMELIMRVHIDKSPLVTLDTVIHEINHAICSLYHIDESDEEERTVTMLSAAWVQVYRDNPELIAWIKQMSS